MIPKRSSSVAQPSVELHIERLVVDEPLLSPDQGGVFQAAIESELARLLGDDASPVSSFPNTPAADAGTVRLTAAPRPAPFARQIARSIHGALGADAPTSRGASSSRETGAAR